MDNFEVTKLVGQHVRVKFSSIGEQKGVIEGVNRAYPSPDKEMAVNLTLFVVRLESGDSLESGGQNFSWIEPSEFYP